jgi:hypothetical protein
MLIAGCEDSMEEAERRLRARPHQPQACQLSSQHRGDLTSLLGLARVFPNSVLQLIPRVRWLVV